MEKTHFKIEIHMELDWDNMPVDISHDLRDALLQLTETRRMKDITFNVEEVK